MVLRLLTSAVFTIGEILRNALAYTLVAWLANYVWSLGNFWSGTPVEKQSRVAFLAASLASSHSLSAMITTVVQALVLRSFQFENSPTHPPTLTFCVLRLVRESGGVFCVTVVLIATNVYLLSLAPVTLRAYRLEFYLACFTGHMFTTSIGISTRHIIKTQTVQNPGSTVQQRESKRSNARLSVTPLQQLQVVQVIPVTSRRRSSVLWSATQLLRFGGIYLKSYRSDLSVIVAGLYVHVATHFGIPSDALGLFLFTAGSLCLKILAQESTKEMISRKNVSDIRTMCVAMGIPTVLIDTQIRIVLLFTKSTAVAVSGTIGLGLVEVFMRIAKVLWLRAHIQRRRLAQANSVVTLTTSGDLITSPEFKRRKTTARALSAEDFIAWERRLWAVHTAELYTDMSAEYMAIGCSTCILYFFAGHPKYMMGRTASPSTSIPGSSETQQPSSSTTMGNWNHVAASLGVQLAVEVLVDLLSCLVETSAGTDFQQLRKYRFFVVSVLVNLAVANIQISGLMFILLVY